ncbi:uncharacterized protein C19orf47 homolog isoform X3 [Austrofundulus limnaeus]|nr:PREDICTED: uncharacterized protein C19orf47 homolog isoform X3 [Austrofundulus limnaeus]XP_013878313.1 PREDICTED: uncharacterized protein C19orf47 homolog isoform X3 [Austrofundulus limnaeus]
MLMDLSKDIMMDLGITVVGDIIAILKHAKQVYRQDMCKMATEAISSGQTSVQAELRRTANTPATRMIANALSHDSPPTTPARRPDNRLSVTVSNSQANKNNKAVVSQPADEGNGLPAVKRRRVTAEMEGKYIINMPKGSTPRTRRILAQQAKKGLKRTSVFERLGAESMADTTTSNNKPTGVFSRLDRADEGEDAPKPGNVAVIVDEDEEESDGEGSVLQYAGILKRPPPQPKKKPTTKAAPVSLRRLGGKFKRPPSDSPTSSSASSPKVPPAKVSILQRLGKLPAASAGVSAAPADTQDNKVTSTKPRAPEKSTVASCKVSSSTGTGGAGGAEPVGAKMDVKAVSVFKRLGSKQP